VSSVQRRVSSQSRAEEYIPLGMRSARRMRDDVWPSLWISFASILLLMATLVILAYRIWAHSSPQRKRSYGTSCWLTAPHLWQMNERSHRAYSRGNLR
jgi:hypothetical protein